MASRLLVSTWVKSDHVGGSLSLLRHCDSAVGSQPRADHQLRPHARGLLVAGLRGGWVQFVSSRDALSMARGFGHLRAPNTFGCRGVANR